MQPVLLLGMEILVPMVATEEFLLPWCEMRLARRHELRVGEKKKTHSER